MATIAEQDLEIRAKKLLDQLKTDHYFIHYEARPRLTTIDELRSLFDNHLASNAKLILATNGYFDAPTLKFIQQHQITVCGNLARQNMPAGIDYQTLPALTNTINIQNYPNHVGEALPIQFPSGRSVVVINYLDNSASVEFFDKHGDSLNNQTAYFYDFDVENQLSRLPVTFKGPQAQDLYVDVDTEGGWEIDIYPAAEPTTSADVYGHGAGTIPLVLPAGTYLVHFTTDVAADEDSRFDDGSLYYYGTGPVDMTKIYQFDEPQQLELQFKVQGDWHFVLNSTNQSEANRS